MTTCNRCGGLLLANATVCRHCGAPVVNPGSTARPLGARQRAQERASGLLSPAPDPFAAFPPQSPPNSSSPYPASRPPTPGGAGAGETWRATSLIDPSHLPEWLNPAAPAAPNRPGRPGDRFQPPGGSNPWAAPPGAAPPPFSTPPNAAGAPRPPTPPTRPAAGNSPYISGGRRATDDLFASSSLLDQSRLPEWLARRPERQPGSALPPQSSMPPARPAFEAAPRPGADAPQVPEDPDANLPPWLRAMEPGAPPPPAPPIARMAGGPFSSGPLRSSPGGNYPPAENRPSLLERRHPLSGTPLSDDPFSISRVDSVSSSPGPLTVSVDPRKPFPAQTKRSAAPTPADPLPRKGNPFSAEFGSQPASPGAPPWEVDKAPGAARTESRAADLAARPTDWLSPGSLIDETSLPDWLRNTRPGGSAIQAPGAPRSAPASPTFGRAQEAPGASRASGFPAPGGPTPLPPMAASPFDGAALVDESSLPDWLRSSSQTEPLPLPFSVSESIGSRNASSETARKPLAGQPARGGADDEELPEWLRQVYTQAQVPSLNQGQPMAGREWGASFQAAELVDERAVPDWVKEAAQTSPLPSLDAVLSAPPLSARQPEPPPRAGASPSSPAASDNPRAEWLEGNALLDEASLPEWLRNIGGPASASPGANRTPAAPPSALGSASGVFSAAELVDTQALPTWLKASEPRSAAEELSGTAEGASAAGSASGVFSAAELVDTQALPTWLKAREPQTADQPAATPEADRPTGSASGVFSAAELVDTQALPTWLKSQDQGAAGDSPAAGAAAPYETSSARPAASSKISPMPAGFSAAELVDTQDLPAWIKGAAPSEPAQGRQARQVEGAERRMPAAELVDTQDLPAWLKGAEQNSESTGVAGGVPAEGESFSAGAAGSGIFQAASLVDQGALPAWLRPAQTGEGAVSARQLENWPDAPASGEERDPFDQSGFSAASLIDEQQLPDWLRSQTGTQRPGAQRIGNDSLEEEPHARVPRRPRLPTEPDRAPSQAAASVFSSVLGPVAGEELRDQPQARQAQRSREAPPTERSSPPGQSGGLRQSAEWEGGDLSGRGQPPSAPLQRGTSQPLQPPRGAFEAQPQRPFEPGMPDNFGAWQGDAANWGAPAAARPERMPGTQRGRQTPPEESERVSGPPNRRAGRTMIGPDFSSTGGWEPPRAGGQAYDDYRPDAQWRGQPQQFAYQSEEGGWEGGPAYDPNFQGDDEVGPPSGVFAKLKRMLGFGR